MTLHQSPSVPVQGRPVRQEEQSLVNLSLLVKVIFIVIVTPSTVWREDLRRDRREDSPCLLRFANAHH